MKGASIFLKAIFIATPLIWLGAFSFRKLLVMLDLQPKIGLSNAVVFFLLAWGPIVIELTLGKEFRRHFKVRAKSRDGHDH
jgi:hypothetical protein